MQGTAKPSASNASAAKPAPTEAAKAAEVKPAESKTAQAEESAKSDAKAAEGEAPESSNAEATKQADGAESPEAKPAETEKVIPEKYDFKVPENSHIGKEQIEEISAHAKEWGLSNDQAQKLLEREHNAAQAGVDAVFAHAKHMSEKWLEEGKADKEIGGTKFAETVDYANYALETLFEGPDIRKVLDESGFGNNPRVLKGFAKIGRMLKSDKIIQPGHQPPEKPPLKSRMYDHPSSPKS